MEAFWGIEFFCFFSFLLETLQMINKKKIQWSELWFLFVNNILAINHLWYLQFEQTSIYQICACKVESFKLFIVLDKKFLFHLMYKGHIGDFLRFWIFFSWFIHFHLYFFFTLENLQILWIWKYSGVNFDFY